MINLATVVTSKKRHTVLNVAIPVPTSGGGLQPFLSLFSVLLYTFSLIVENDQVNHGVYIASRGRFFAHLNAFDRIIIGAIAKHQMKPCKAHAFCKSQIRGLLMPLIRFSGVFSG